MPPKKPLPETEKRLLREWIAGGRHGGPIRSIRSATRSDARAGYDWWSLQPVRRPDPPRVKDDRLAGGRHRPLRAGASSRPKGLSPRPTADRRTLIRRLSFDLLGLPPTPEEVERVRGRRRRPTPTSELVDRLLASPHYGERWARHWLDVVRFGESQGFERDKLRPNRLAVSRLGHRGASTTTCRTTSSCACSWPATCSARTIRGRSSPPGFSSPGPCDEVGQIAAKRGDEGGRPAGRAGRPGRRDGQTFLGLTVNCARCHDHKFDPISQTEYYRLGRGLCGCPARRTRAV